MDYESLKELGVEQQEVMKRLDGAEDFYIIILKKFLEDTSCDKIESSFSAEDYAGVFHGAHTLRGVAASLGLSKLRDIAACATEQFRGGNPKDSVHAEEMLMKLRKEYDKAKITISAL